MRRSISIFALVSSSALAVPSNSELPELPTIDRDVVMIDDSDYLQPHITSNRSSADGRVVVVPKTANRKIEFYLRKPEALTAHFSQSANSTVGLLGNADSLRVRMSGEEYFDGGFSHVAVCDTTDFYLRQQAQNASDPRYLSVFENEYVSKLSPEATDGTTRDKYKLTIIGMKNNNNGDGVKRLVSIPFDVVVVNPKTKDAYIESATPGEMQQGPVYKGDSLLEPMVTGDGRLLVARFGDSTPSVTWQDNNGNTHTTSYANIFYAYNDDKAPCDVSGWDQQRPIKYAPFDDEINDKYGFASQHFRYPNGSRVSPNNENFTTGFGATYPWIDRDGNNLFFTVQGRFLEDGDYALDGCDACLGTQRSVGTLTVAMAGLWTRGKIVIPDNLINNTDWGFQIGDRPSVKLYRGNRGWVDAGVGRDNGNNSTSAHAWNRNSTIIDSTEQLFNYNPNMKPLTPRDVVWQISNGKATDEIVFDDYMDLNALIVSDMNGHFGLQVGRQIQPLSTENSVMVQNAATGTSNSIPSYGEVVGGSYKRIEPQAMGGIKGKGLWLHEANHLAYNFTSKPSNSNGWLLSMFVDARMDAQTDQRYTLVSLASGGQISLRSDSAGSTFIEFGSAGTSRLNSRDITDQYQIGTQGWKHIAIEVRKKRNRANRVSVFIDGNEVADFRLAKPLRRDFSLARGTMKIGEGFKGWIDEVRLFNHRRINNEYVCNLGHGSLISSSNGNQCLTDYTQDGYSHLADKDAYEWVGEQLHQPNVVVWNQPRPSEAGNNFCLSCHSSDGKFGLSLDALSADSGIWASDDARRQPMDPPSRVLGQIPQNWLQDAFPQTHLSVGEEGYLVDEVIHPD
ncbi:LamG domain-containing protein [Grimontia kaedaensis]|uniref:LamG domain-containing protein n=1 Tax=Grimontia kaedaensis TaxID=2872157 RepID=A0ABY4WR30_9GAMM|nr:LamG domain-containing protein [Grimontia kaedaensis]USH01730.1 LamG domain-containing protein [Grimontia kaedaensis]